MVTFHNPGNGTIAFKHIAKTFGDGRPINEAEAVATAKVTRRDPALALPASR